MGGQLRQPSLVRIVGDRNVQRQAGLKRDSVTAGIDTQEEQGRIA